MDFAAIRNAAEAYKPAMVKFLRDMIAIPSESCEEEGVVKRIADELKALGLDVPQATELADRLGFAEHAVLNTAECVDVLISNLEEQKLGCTDL